MKEYTVIYEHGANNWSAYVPDLPGCIATMNPGNMASLSTGPSAQEMMLPPVPRRNTGCFSAQNEQPNAVTVGENSYQ